MRLLYIDHLRGFAILLVILGHIYITKAPGNGHYAYADIIYSFHMSLFFFISGFLAFRTNQIKEKGKTQYIIKKTQRKEISQSLEKKDELKTKNISLIVVGVRI